MRMWTWTTTRTHELLRRNISCSPLYSGAITGVGARYCPSLEDKVMRFTDKDRHPVVLEPEGRHTGEMYAKGLGNCLPLDLQLQIVRSIPGLEEAEIMLDILSFSFRAISLQKVIMLSQQHRTENKG